jgi:hypothetical protein
VEILQLSFGTLRGLRKDRAGALSVPTAGIAAGTPDLRVDALQAPIQKA